MKVVISQPMYFPWVGMLEQIALADLYIHYSDVQFSKGSFTNRVQIKTRSGVQWLTVPLEGLKLGQCINEVRVSRSINWKDKHRHQLSEAYQKSPFFEDMMSVVEEVFRYDYTTIAEVSEASIESVCRYFGLSNHLKFLHSSKLGVNGTGSNRVLNIVKVVAGTEYITGHGARNYLDHTLFELEGINVSYMNYQKKSYNQLNGDFTPFVSSLDLIANEGTAGKSIICSDTLSWKEFLKNG